MAPRTVASTVDLPTGLAANGVGTADVVIAATGDDEDNLVVSLLAKQEFGVPRVAARVNHPKNQWLFNETWGVDVAVSTPHIITGSVEEAFTVGQLVQLIGLRDGETGLHEVRLADSSPAVGASIGSLALPRESTVVAVIRENRVIVPRPDITLLADDEVLLLAGREDVDGLEAILVG